MPVAPSMPENGVHQPLMPLNIGSRPSTLQSKPVSNLKPPKPEYNDVDICHVRVDEDIVDSQLAGRLVTTSIEQFLFFKGQIPFPLSRLSTAPAPNDRVSRKRSEFLSQHRQLLVDLKRAVQNGAVFPNREGDSPACLRCVVTLGPGTMPKTMALIQLTELRNPKQPEQTSEPQSPLPASASSHESKLSETWNEQSPPDSDIESDDSESQDENQSTAGNPIPDVQPTPTTKSRPLFTPFSDPSIHTIKHPHLQDKDAPSNLLAAVPPLHSNVAKPLSTSSTTDENASSIQALERRYKKAERDVIIAIGNMSTMSEEADPAKIHIYIEAHRDFDEENWQPRPTAAKNLDALVQYPNIAPSARTKLARLNACAIKVSNIDKEEALSSTVFISEAPDGIVWFEWDGKLSAVE